MCGRLARGRQAAWAAGPDGWHGTVGPITTVGTVTVSCHSAAGRVERAANPLGTMQVHNGRDKVRTLITTSRLFKHSDGADLTSESHLACSYGSATEKRRGLASCTTLDVALQHNIYSSLLKRPHERIVWCVTVQERILPRQQTATNQQPCMHPCRGAVAGFGRRIRITSSTFHDQINNSCIPT